VLGDGEHVRGVEAGAGDGGAFLIYAELLILVEAGIGEVG
jgi:hypothetical protein